MVNIRSQQLRFNEERTGYISPGSHILNNSNFDLITCSIMKTLKYGISVLFAVILTFQFGCKESDEGDIDPCRNVRCFSIEKFAQSLDDRLTPAALGYSYAIYDGNSLKKWGQNGQARRPQDGNEFDVNAINVDMNVASCAKSITTIALLQLLEKKNLTLDEPIKDFLPEWWPLGPNVEIITFMDLLTQKSGFRPSSDAVNYVQIMSAVRIGIKLGDNGVDNYQNMNFCILRIIIPILDGTFDKTTSISNVDAESKTTSQFMDYLRAKIFAPLTIEGSCDNFHDVMYYNFSNPSGMGWPVGNKCNNAGGGTLSLSANDLCKIIAYSKNSTSILSPAMSALMFNKLIPLGSYNSNVNADENWGDHFHHNGGIKDGAGRGATACWYTFHNGISVAVSTNSSGGIKAQGYDDINDLIEQAFDSGWTP
jgi:CubicO group peptidase (beta-lactamase class C family)